MAKVITTEELLGVSPAHPLVQTPTEIAVSVKFKLDQTIRSDLFSVYAFCLNEAHDLTGKLIELHRHQLVKDQVCETTFQGDLDASMLSKVNRIGLLLLVDNAFDEHVGFHLLEDVSIELLVDRRHNYSSQMKTMPYLIERTVLLGNYAAGQQGWEFDQSMLALDRGIRSYIEQLKPKPGKYAEWF